MTPWFELTLATLAAWRVTHLLAHEDGPFDILVRLRAILGSSFVGRLMDCFQCLSLWVSAPLAVWVGRGISETFVTWLAISGAACLLERLTANPLVMHPLPEDGFNGLLRPETRPIEDQATDGHRATD
jgi:hypothetical protein